VRYVDAEMWYSSEANHDHELALATHDDILAPWTGDDIMLRMSGVKLLIMHL
jgi:hypothetical protein